MPKRSSKDINRAAKRLVDRVTGEAPPQREKNPAAVELGRLGGKKGGKARAQKLTAARRKEIAQQAAEARWAKARQAEAPPGGN